MRTRPQLWQRYSSLRCAADWRVCCCVPRPRGAQVVLAAGQNTSRASARALCRCGPAGCSQALCVVPVVSP